MYAVEYILHFFYLLLVNKVISRHTTLSEMSGTLDEEADANSESNSNFAQGPSKTVMSDPRFLCQRCSQPLKVIRIEQKGEFWQATLP